MADKPYYRISEAARIVGVAPHVLRHWEKLFPSLKPPRAASGQRLYQPEHIERFKLVRRLLHEEGYSVAGVRRRLERGEAPGLSPQPPEPLLKELAQELRQIIRMLS